MTNSTLLEQARAFRQQLEQLQSSDPDALLSPEWQQELDALQDCLMPAPLPESSAPCKEELQGSLEKLQLAQTTTQLSFYEYNFDQKQGRTDQYQKDLFGFERILTPEEFLTRLHQEDREVMKRILFLEGEIPVGSTLKQTYRYLHPERGWRWMEFSGHFLELPNGERVVRGFDRDVTQDNQQWREEQKHLLQELDLVLQADQLGYALIDLETGTLERWNTHYLEYNHIDLHASFSMWDWLESRVHPDDQPLLKEAIDSIVQQPGKSVKLTLRLPDADGTMHWIEARGQIQIIEKRLKVLNITRDLTQQVQQEAEREALLTQLQREIEQGQRARQLNRSGYWSWNVPTDTISWSPEVYDLFQIPLEQHLELQTYREATHPEDRAFLESQLKETLESKQGYAIEHRIITSDGSIRRIEAKGALRLDDQGQPLELYGVVTDITEKWHAQQDRELLLQRLQLAMHTAQFGFAESCIDTGERQFDETYAQMQELDGPEEVAFDTMMHRVHPEDRPLMRRLVFEELPTLPHGTPLTFTYRYQMKDGSWQWREASTTLNIRNGQRWRIGVIRDVTALMAQQETLRRHERFAALGQLATEINHDLKQPLSTLELRLHQLKDLLAPEHAQKGLRSVQAAEAALKHARAIMSRTLKTAGAEDEVQEQPLTPIIHQVTELFESTFQHQSIAFQTQFPWDDPEQEPLIRLNRKEMIQVIQNLLSNAVDGIREQQEQVPGALKEIRLTLAEHDTSLQLDLYDTGIGIPEEVIGKIFEQFFTTKGEHGSGLGLSMCRRILQEHQGTLEARNREDHHGAHFRITLPKVS